MFGFLVFAGTASVVCFLVWLAGGGYGLLILLAVVVALVFLGWLGGEDEPRSAYQKVEKREDRSIPVNKLQPIVRCLMKTLLEDHPTLLSDTLRRNLMKADYCKNDLGLTLSNLALLREVKNGRRINGYPRYWAKRYADRYYVCSEWWRDHHCHNARMLRRFVDKLGNRNLNDPGVLALKRHAEALEELVSETTENCVGCSSQALRNDDSEHCGECGKPVTVCQECLEVGVWPICTKCRGKQAEAKGRANQDQDTCVSCESEGPVDDGAECSNCGAPVVACQECVGAGAWLICMPCFDRDAPGPHLA